MKVVGHGIDAVRFEGIDLEQAASEEELQGGVPPPHQRLNGRLQSCCCGADCHCCCQGAEDLEEDAGKPASQAGMQQ